MFFPECPFHGGPVQAIGCRATNPQCLWERHSQGCWRGRALSMQFANDHPGRSQHFPLKRIEQVLFLWQVISEQFRILKTNELLHIGGSKGALSPGAEVERLRRTNDALCQQASGISGDAKTTTSRHAQLSGAWSRRRGPFCRSSRTGGSCMAFVWDFIRKTTWRRSPKPWELHQKSSRDLRLGLRFDKIYDIYYSTYSNAPSMNQTGIKQYSTKAWCLWSQVSVLDGEEDQAIRDEIGRLVRQDIELNMWGKSGWPCRLMQAERSCAVSVTCLLNMKTGKVKTTGLLLESTLAGNSWRLCRLHELILWFESP